MVLSTKVYPPGRVNAGQKGDIIIAGFTPCNYKKAWITTAVKARWIDGAESEWYISPQDKLGSRDLSIHFNRSAATIPLRGTTNWFPVNEPKGYVDFYNGPNRHVGQFRIYHIYGTEECFVGMIPGSPLHDSEKGVNFVSAGLRRLRIPCQAGENIFAVGVGLWRKHVSVPVRENAVTPVRIDSSRISEDSNGGVAYTAEGLQFMSPGAPVYRVAIDAVVEPYQPIGHP